MARNSWASEQLGVGTVLFRNRSFRLFSVVSESEHALRNAVLRARNSWTNLDCPVEEPYEDFEIETIGNGRYRTSFHVARCYFPIVIGSKGVVRRRLENETRTQIQVPKQGQDGHIVITGASRSGVEAAHRRVDLIVAAARNRQQFTHFLSIPLNGESVQKRFHQFKEEVLDLCGHSRGISASIFQAPEKLHLTLGTLVIMDAEERERAAQCLTLCKESIVQPLLRGETLAVRMVGVEYMNDDPAEVDILYGKVHVEGNDNSHVLQDLADGIVGHFTSRGMMQKQYERVKLHVTLMNTLFRSEESSDIDSDKQRPRESFDATGILKSSNSTTLCGEELAYQTRLHSW
ncbi:activating signal cointegrator 1 complex subunit 1 isoform X6 [Periplaneta americana]|uniref:activating signal cointegrator 1 complex subunit 1 isoform X6 n=1 Tax=Periplaneta americana TaxID=6978 RepID=UPI0037E7C5E4